MTRVGVAVSSKGLLERSDLLRELLDASGAIAVSYLPLDYERRVRPPSQLAADLDALIETITADPPQWQAQTLPSLVLQQVSYPSAEGAGSSPTMQADFFQLFFQALQARRERFPFVVVDGLHDASDDRCAVAAEARGAPGDPAAIAALCSLGLRDGEGNAKMAFKPVLQALARFSVP